MTDHSALIERLEAAEAGSRELDALVEDVFDPLVTCDGPGSHADFLDEPAFEADVGRYTTSLDAALALAERVLPGWDWLLRTDKERGFMLNCWKRGDEPNLGDMCFPSYAPTPALALCIAILKAKAQGEGG